ncbi:hypothetical protein [Yoonia sp. BS5-3]|uniref:Uncharacterized protein n=1 Tax=Yoonia phaeophyticola TaxID=3137369 RepID=A0ABZ2V3Y7_9RHOB
MRILLPLYGLVLTAFAVAVLFVFKSGLDDYVAARGLAASAIVAPDGWELRDYKRADGELITQAVFDPAVTDTTQQLLARFETRDGGISQSTLTTFLRGDERLALRISKAPHMPPRQSLAARFGRVDDSPDTQEEREGVFATLAGLPIIEEPRFSHGDGGSDPMPVNYRHFTTVIGDQAVDEVLEVSILTNASDAAVLTVLNSLDMEVLHAQLPTPDPRVIVSAGVLSRDPLPLSDAPPLPSPAYRAMQLLAAGKVFDAPWQDALMDIRMGKIDSWDDLKVRYPQVDTLPVALLDVLDDGTHENAARYFAAILSNSGRAWSAHEYHVLATISAAGTTQSDLAEYLSGQFDIAPEVIALAQRLPEAAPDLGPETQVVQSEVAAPVTGLRNGATCVMENGFRRCTVMSN